MNFFQLSDWISDACVADAKGDDFFDEAQIRRNFDVPESTVTAKRLRASETKFLLSDADDLIRTLTASGVFKLALTGRNRIAEALRVVVAGEILPDIVYPGHDNIETFADSLETSLPVNKLLAPQRLREVALWYAALVGETPEDVDFQDWLAEEVLPVAMEDGAFTPPLNCERFWHVSAQLSLLGR